MPLVNRPLTDSEKAERRRNIDHGMLNALGGGLIGHTAGDYVSSKYDSRRQNELNSVYDKYNKKRNMYHTIGERRANRLSDANYNFERYNRELYELRKNNKAPVEGTPEWNDMYTRNKHNTEALEKATRAYDRHTAKQKAVMKAIADREAKAVQGINNRYKWNTKLRIPGMVLGSALGVGSGILRNKYINGEI